MQNEQVLKVLLEPRQLGRGALLLALLSLGGGFLVIPLVSHSLARGATLGETGTLFVDGVRSVSLYLGLVLACTGGLLLDVRGVASSLDRRWPDWRVLGAATWVVLTLSGVFWSQSFVRQFLVILGPGSEFYDRAEWLGIPLFISNEVFQRTDFFTVLFLLLAASSAGGAFLRGRHTALHLPGEVFGLFAVGFTFLALDEYLTIHEFVGANLPWLKDVTFVGHPDDLVMVAYFGIAGMLLLPYWRLLLSDRPGMTTLAGAFALQGIAAFGDAYFPPSLWSLEEVLEVASAGCYYLFVVRYGQAVALPGR